MCVCVRPLHVRCQIYSLHSDCDRQTLCSRVTHTHTEEEEEGEGGGGRVGRERTSLLVIQLMDYVLFK